ncbi:hypothetical protein INT45_002893 [Circinella minor]|uniref:FHA domain-containing protein n=1 Tax=Circinella minor TaxID=1195481 RepID=A0A8H7S7B8_9FUNG|nr:hypothetical protein INT45_002893 [Circinella minor]
MWFLYKLDEQNQNTGEKILARPGCEYTIGRKGTFITFNDKSVSRSHAKIIIGEQNSRDAFNKHFIPEVRLTDQNSKYGTFLNTIQVETESVLANRDMIKFGSLNSALRLVWESVVICVPSMSNSDKVAIAKLACHAKRIISIQWLKALLDQNDGTFTWPDESNYFPPIPSSISNIKKEDCEPKPERGSLFSNLEFRIFDKDQFDRYTPIIKSAGGTSKLCSLRVLYSINELCESNRVIVTPPERCQEQFNEIVGKLAKKHKRTIEGNEISDAIIACSRSKYCNPTIPEDERTYSILESSIVLNDYNDEKQEEDDIVIMSDLPSSLPSRSMTPSHADVESTSMGDFFDDLLGEPDTLPDYPSAPQAPPLTFLREVELNDGANHRRQHSNNSYDAPSDSELAVPEHRAVSNKQKSNQSRQQLGQESTVPESKNDEEVSEFESSTTRAQPWRQLPGQITNTDVPEVAIEGAETATTRSRNSTRRLPGQLQISATNNNDITAEPTEPTSLIRPTRSRRQLPGTNNALPEPENPPQTSTGLRRTMVRETMDQQPNRFIVNDSSSTVTEPTPSRRQTTLTTTTTIRSRRQNTGARRRTNNNDEFPSLPDTEQDYNQEIPLVPGKKYTAILTGRIICSTPSNNIRPRAQVNQDGDCVNFKRFKKVHRSTPYNAIDFIPAALTQEDRNRLCGMLGAKKNNYYGDEEDELEDSIPSHQSPSVPAEGFGDIEIKVVRATASRRPTRR